MKFRIFIAVRHVVFLFKPKHSFFYSQHITLLFRGAAVSVGSLGILVVSLWGENHGVWGLTWGCHDEMSAVFVFENFCLFYV